MKKSLRIDAEFPEKLQFLFRPYRYKVARGGRGAGAKSWSFARGLLIQGIQNSLRVLCVREVQNSIKQSVHQLLRDQIVLMGLGSFYTVTETEIRGKNGTLFTFSGLSQLTVDTIKSFEGYDRCWVEEGQAITDRSWSILLPTIRKEGSEIWITFNPDLETDPTYVRFVENPPKNCMSVFLRPGRLDNKWWSDELEQQRLYDKKYRPDDYENIWEGKCRPAVEGAIFYKQIQTALDQGRVCNVPYDPQLKVQIVFDLGWEDSLGCALVQTATSEIRVIEYLEANQTDWNAYSTELRLREYNWGRVWLPHDGYAKQLNSKGKSSYDILTKLGWDVASREEITELGKEEGIKQTRMMFPRMYFDSTKCDSKSPIKSQAESFHATSLNGRLIECAKRYRRSVNQKTGSPGGTVRDEFAHGGDVLRYIALNADNMTNETGPKIKLNPVKTGLIGRQQPATGWMAG